MNQREIIAHLEDKLIGLIKILHRDHSFRESHWQDCDHYLCKQTKQDLRINKDKGGEDA